MSQLPNTPRQMNQPTSQPAASPQTRIRDSAVVQYVMRGGGSAAGVALSPLAKPANWAIIFAFVLLFIDMRYHFYGFEVTHFITNYRTSPLLEIVRAAYLNIFVIFALFAYIGLKTYERAGRTESTVAVTIGFVAMLGYSFFMKVPFAFATLWEMIAFLVYVVYLFAFKPSSRDALATFFLTFFILNLYHFGFFYGIAAIHILYALIFYFFTLSKITQDSAGAKYALIVLICLDLFCPNIIGGVNSDLPLRFAVPFWLIFSIGFVWAKGEADGFNILAAIGALGILLILSGAGPQSLQHALFPQALGDDAQTDDLKNQIKDPRSWYKKIADYLTGEVNRSVYYASGQDYYTSKVDENAKKKLGVYIEDIERNPKEFYDNEGIDFEATITAENFMSEEESTEPNITVTLSCGAYKDSKLYATGKILPQENYFVQNYDRESIRCIFEPWQLEQGRYEIRMNAKFNFKTEAYLKTYFVSKDRIDTLRRKQLITRDEDILNLNKIDDINPIAKNSVGPVEIKLNDNMPSITKLDYQTGLRQNFGVMLENKWKGKIDKVKNIYLFLPVGMSIEPGTCKFSMIEGSVPNYQKYEGYKMYELSQGGANPLLSNIEKSVKQSCTVVVKTQDVNDILSPGDVTTRYYRLSADYDYTLQEKSFVTVKKPEGFHVKIISPDGKLLTSASPVTCEADNNNNLNSKVDFKLYKGESTQIMGEGTLTCLPDQKCRYTFDNTYLEKGTLIRCEAIAMIESDGVDQERTVAAYATVKNSPPKITSMTTNVHTVDKGSIVRCETTIEDEDKDKVAVQFDFEGLNIASTQRECEDNCYVDIPTDKAEKETTLKCIATPYDGSEKGSSQTKEVKILVPTNT